MEIAELIEANSNSEIVMQGVETIKNYRIYGSAEGVGQLVSEGQYQGKYKIPITVSGKNLIDYKTFASRNQSLYPLTINNDGSLEYTGNYYIQANASFLKGGKAYVLNCKYEGDVVPFWRIKYADGTYSSRIVLDDSYTIDENKNVEHILIYVEMTTTIHSVKVWDIQLEEGENGTAYEPYVEPRLYEIIISEPLRSSEEGTDYIDFSKQKVVRMLDSNGKRLAEPKEEGIEDGIIIPEILTNKGTTKIAVDTAIQPSDFVIEY